MPTGLMFTCETSNCKVEICNFCNLFFNQMIVAPLCEQTLLYLYAVNIRVMYILVPEEKSFDWSCIIF